jgi:hypothetical protein
MIITLILAAAVAAPSPICTQLAAEYAQTNASFALMHRVYQGRVDLELATGTVLATEQAIKQRNDSDEEFRLQGDRIMTLMLAHKCPPPAYLIGSPVGGAQ